MPPADAVSESAVLARRLPRVTFVAKRLEVVNAPEQVRISLVRPDVIYVRGGRYLVMPQAFLAQRMRGDVPVTKLLPPIAVASGVRVSFVQKATPLGSGSAFGADFLVPRRSFLFVPLAVLVSQRYGGLTAWISANMEKRHTIYGKTLASITTKQYVIPLPLGRGEILSRRYQPLARCSPA